MSRNLRLRVVFLDTAVVVGQASEASHLSTRRRRYPLEDGMHLELVNARLGGAVTEEANFPLSELTLLSFR